MKKIESILTMAIALTIMFISSNSLFFVWRSIIGYYLLIILASFLGGAIIMEFESSLKVVAATYIVGSILFILLYISPSMVYGEAYPREIDSLVAIITTELAKTVIISFPISVFTCLFGTFSGKALTES
jgi:hypothetical protein